MNLFRSEEHVKSWSNYNPDSERSILPIADWAYAMGSPVFSKRLDDDYLEETEPYWDDFLARLNELDAYWE